MKERTPAEGFLPGELIKEELEARGWTQDDLAEILGRNTCSVNEIITGKRGISVESAKGLSEAFGTSAQFWLNLESAYRLSLEKTRPEAIARKAMLYSIAPVRAMIKRNWIEASTNVDVLEQRLREFFNTTNLKNIPQLKYSARKSTLELTPAQNVWLYRAKNLAKTVNAGRFSKSRLNAALEKLKTMLVDESNIKLIPKVLADCGIKFIIIEPFPGSKIDGISFWIDGSPVIAMSLRYDRIDSFWHTLIHGIAHIKNEDGFKETKIIVDNDLFDDQDDDKPVYEKKADEFAVNFLVPQDALDDFMARVHPLYTKTRITRFASKIGVHPGIIAGQIQHRNRDYSHNRDLLIRVRSLITSVAFTDGYGQLLPAV